MLKSFFLVSILLLSGCASQVCGAWFRLNVPKGCVYDPPYGMHCGSEHYTLMWRSLERKHSHVVKKWKALKGERGR